MRLNILLACIWLAAAALVWAALPVTDNFTNTGGTVLTTHNAAWAFQTSGGSFSIQSNNVRANSTSQDCFARWTGDTFNDDQYAQLTNVSSVNGNQLGPAVRMDLGGTKQCYVFKWTATNQRQLVKWVSGSGTILGTTNATTTATDVYKIEAIGTTITPYINGSIDAMGAKTDSAVTTGAAGMQGYGTNTANTGDDWSAGNTGGGGSAARRRIIITFLDLNRVFFFHNER